MRVFTPFYFLVGSLIMVAAAPRLGAQTTVTGDAAPLTLDGHQQRHLFTAGSANQILTFENLIPGESYSLIVPEDPALAACRPVVAAADSATEVLGYEAAVHQLRFKAHAKTMQFQLTYPCNWPADNPPRHYVSLICDTCKKKTFRELMESSAVLEVGPGTADELIRDVMIGGDCFDVENVTFSGNAGQIGTFSNGLTNIGFASGMIMATGDVSVAVGPNDQDNASAGFGSSTFDGDLSALSGSSAIFDLANIEFDFTPTQSPLTFEFVFGSEEYCEYVGSQFNDAFGFFISGPGISGPFGGSANIAVIPMSTTYVAINNINHLSNSGLFVNNQSSNSGNLCGQNPSFAPSTNEVQFDGFTRKMIATANVIPCSTYHIKLKICDIGDGIFDSGVFLKSSSFDAGGNASVNFVVNGDPSLEEVYESCGTVQLIFDRVGANLNVPLPVSFTVSGTATPGVDYAPIPASVIIPPGQDKLVLPITIFTDLLLEGQESIIIKLNNPCSCQNPTEILLINDLPPLDVIPDTVTICGPGVAVIGANVTSGVEPYTFSWANGGTDSQISPYVTSSQNFKVTVTDACGKTTVETARVIVNSPPNAQLLPPAPQICPGGTGTLQINFNGTGPFTIDYNLNGNPQPTITDITDDPYTLIISQPGLYQLVSIIDGGGCPGVGQGALLVSESTLSLVGQATSVKCNGQANGSINTTVTGGQGPFTYTWSGPTTVGNIPDPTNLAAGNYSVTVTDGFGCQSIQTFTVNQPGPLVPAVGSVQGVNCTNPTGGSINLNVTGGNPIYTFNWSPGGGTVQNPTGLAAGTYTVTVTDQQGCTKTTTATVPADLTPPTAAAAVNGSLTCQTTTLTLDGAGSSTGPNYTYNWTASPGGNIVSGGQTLNPVVNQGATYTLVVTNTTNGCTASAPVTVNSNATLPAANAGANQTLTCALVNVTLDGSGSSQGTGFTYNWTPSQGGTIIGGQGTANPVAGTPGLYTLVVTNTANGCTSTDQVEVNSNTAAPSAVIAQPGLLTCTVATLSLNGSGSTPAGNLSYLWTTSNGTITGGATQSSATVSSAGQYTLQVTNNLNGCTATQTVSVVEDYTDPDATVTVSGPLTCATSLVTLNGSSSSSGTTYTFVWSSSPGGNFVSGQNTLTPTVNAPGTYTLVVTNTISQCTTTASILVAQDNQAPPANPGPPAMLTCTTTQLQLGDPNAPLAGLTYSWTAGGGGNIVSGQNTPTPTVNQPGTYQLQVLNPQNGCSSTASVTINQNVAAPSAVAAPGGQLNCTSPAIQLNGAGSSTGANFSYEWTSSSGGGIGSGATTLTPTVTAAGTYTLVVTNASNGCTASTSTTVTVNANVPTAIAQPSGIITCAQQQVTLDAAGSTTGPTISYQWGTTNGLIVSGQGTPVITVGLPGQYTLVVSNTANSCSATFPIVVEADQVPPVADAGVAQTLNCTVPALTLDGSASSQGSNFTYQWTASQGGNFVSPTNIASPQVNEGGTYVLVVTNTQNGCTATDAVVVQQDAGDPVVQIAPPAVLNCTATEIQLNSTGSSTGATFGYAWTGPGIVSGQQSGTPTINLPGTYTLMITNSANGCTSTSLVDVTQDVAIPPVNAGLDGILNCTTQQLTIGGAGNPSGAGYTFQWAGPGFVSGSGTASPVVNQGGTYTLVVTNTANGCSATDQVTLATDFALPQADAGPTFELTCVETTYTLGATASQGPNFTYNWTTPTGNFTGAYNVLNPEVNGAGQYFLTVTNTTNGCTSTASVVITQSDDVPSAVGFAPGQLDCDDLTLTLTGQGSSAGPQYTYEWYPDPVGNIVSGATTLSPVVDQPGIYTLKVTDTTNNCPAFTSVTVTQDIVPPVIEAGDPQTLTCATNTLTLTGTAPSTGAYTTVWTSPGGGNIVSGQFTLTPTINAVGTYVLTVQSVSNGCTSTDAVEILEDLNAPVVAIAPADPLTCAVLQMQIDATGSSTGATMQYTWTASGGGYIVDQTDPLQPVVNEPGTYTLEILNTANGCVETAAVEVAEDVQPPVAEAGAGGVITCATTSLQLNGSGSTQGANMFYQWTPSGGGVILTGANSQTPTITAGGTYLLTVKNLDNGCTDDDPVVIATDTQNPVAAIATPAMLNCVVVQTTLSGSATPAGPNISYAWITAGGHFVGNQEAAQVMVDQPGAYTLIVQNTTNGCTGTAQVAVTENVVPPIAEAGSPLTLNCTVEQASLQGSGSSGSIFTYSWSTPDGQILAGNNTLTPVVTEPGVYTLLVTNTLTGCTQTDNVPVFVENNVPTAFAVSELAPTCKNDDAVISFGAISGGVAPYLFSIDGGQTFSPADEFANLTPNTYDVQIQDANGCILEETVLIHPTPAVTLTLTPEISLAFGESAQIIASLGLGYPYTLLDSVVWEPTDGLFFDSTISHPMQRLLQPTVLPLKPTQYTCTVYSGGCEASDRVLLLVDSDPAIYIPNAISPWDEGDNNDKVVIFANEKQVKQVNYFRIFDRWGEMVFADQGFLPNDPEHGWNGTLKGKRLTPAVFVYVAEIELIDGRIILFKGDVAIVR